MSVLASVPKLQKQSFPSRSLAPSRLSSTRGQSWAHFLLRGRIRNHQQPPPSLSFQNCPEQTDCCLIILQSLLAARLQELLLQDHCIYFRSVKRKPIICSSDGPILRVQQVWLPTCLMPWSRLSRKGALQSCRQIDQQNLQLPLQVQSIWHHHLWVFTSLRGSPCLVCIAQDSKIFRVQPTWAYQRPLG